MPKIASSVGPGKRKKAIHTQKLNQVFTCIGTVLMAEATKITQLQH